MCNILALNVVYLKMLFFYACTYNLWHYKVTQKFFMCACVTFWHPTCFVFQQLVNNIYIFLGSHFIISFLNFSNTPFLHFCQENETFCHSFVFNIWIYSLQHFKHPCHILHLTWIKSSFRVKYWPPDMIQQLFSVHLYFLQNSSSREEQPPHTFIFLWFNSTLLLFSYFKSYIQNFLCTFLIWF